MMLPVPSPISLFSRSSILSPSRPSISSSMATQTPPPSSSPRRIVVCGGGVIGACTAYFLSKNSASSSTHITVVEKSSPACAASGKAGGFLALDWCDGGPLSSLARASFALHRSLSSLLDGPNTYSYRPLHTLSFPILSPSASSSDSSPTSKSLFPDWVDGPTARTPKTIGTPETTAQVHPRLFTRAVLAAAGVEILIAEVEEVKVAEGRVVGVGLRGREEAIPADAVVLALGPWSDRSKLVSDLFNVSGLKAHSIVLRPKDPDKITPHALSLSYQPAPGAKILDYEVYPRPTGEVYICGISKEVAVPDDPEEIVGEREYIEMLYKIAGEVSSHLRKEEVAEVVAEQACFLPCTDDGLPVIGEIPGVDGCYVATGHSCWGILNGPATGAAVAELILEGKSTTVDLKPFSPSRFIKRRTRLGM
ncbi:D-amino-acid oxidase [Typha angustifolia]|uniref:D-amino-acid oxidase n=1 Tax=Typha angustifolia TaxID=59011 RepID=UPI003C2EC1E1